MSSRGPLDQVIDSSDVLSRVPSAAGTYHRSCEVGPGRDPWWHLMPEAVTVLSFGQPRLVDGPARVNFKTSCVVDASGVTLYRWPWRSIHVPLEQVDRFDVVLKDPVQDVEHPQARDPVPRLVLRTRDGKVLRVSGIVNPWRAGPRQACALQLNNHIVRLNRRRQQPPDHEAGEPPE